MTGKLARLLVGTCMTAALTVSGLAGGMPAAHAGGGGDCHQVQIVGVLQVQCVNVNVTPNTEVDVTLVKIGDVTTTIKALNDNFNYIFNDNNIANIATKTGAILSNNHINLCDIQVIQAGVISLTKCSA